jgi:hypothetical protein
VKVLLQLHDEPFVGTLVECYNPTVRQIPCNHDCIVVNRIILALVVNPSVHKIRVDHSPGGLLLGVPCPTRAVIIHEVIELNPLSRLWRVLQRPAATAWKRDGAKKWGYGNHNSAGWRVIRRQSTRASFAKFVTHTTGAVPSL